MPIHSTVALSNTFNEFRTAFNDVANTTNSLSAAGNDYTRVPVFASTLTANTVVSTNASITNLTSSTLTSGRVALVGTDGLLQDDSGLTFNTTTNALTATGTINGANLTTAGAVSTGTLEVTGTSRLLGNTTFGTGANNAVYYPANGSLILTSSGDASGTGRLDANHVHGEWHVGAGGDLETWATAKGDNSDTHKVFGVTTVDGPIDMLIVNESEGANAYAEFIAIHATGNTADGWVSMGVNSSNYAEGAFGVTKADDAYVLYSAPVGTTESGDLVIGTSSNGTGNKIIFSANGFDDPANNQQMIIHPAEKVAISINTQSSNTTTGALVVNGGIGLRGNLNVGGNVAITGTITLGGGGNTVSTSSLSVDNPLIFLGANNAADVLDLGVIGEYTSSGVKYAGLVRDASDSGIFKLFANNSSRPNNTVNFSDANVAYGTLLLNTVRANGGTASSSNTTGTIIVTGGVGVAGRVSADVVHDQYGNLRALAPNAQSGSYTATVADIGRFINTTAGVTVPSGVFAVGDNFTIYNNSGSTITITEGGGVTLRQAGTSNTGNRSLALRGVCTVLCVATNEFVINGGGLT
jgi:hypothetical protein